MILPETYYGPGSYDKWMRVGWALRNTSNQLLILWIAFSSKSSEFQLHEIHDLYNRWHKFECPEDYNKINSDYVCGNNTTTVAFDETEQLVIDDDGSHTEEVA